MLVLSPSKTQDFSQEMPAVVQQHITQPVMLSALETLVGEVRKSIADLARLMDSGIWWPLVVRSLPIPIWCSA